MIQRQLLHIQIYKKLVLVVAAFIFFVPQLSDAQSVGKVDSVSSRNAIKKTADDYFSKASTTNDKQEQLKIFQKASERYYMLSQLNPEDIYPIIQLGRIYSECGKERLAKEYFYRAVSLDNSNTEANYHFGKYYASRKKYSKAIEFYNKAYDGGMTKSPELMLNMAEIYEKLGDLLRANYYYKKAFLLDPENSDVADKIRSIESLKYKNSGYYSRQGK